ncbi:MAG TPA: restriction endonuclease [Candidatus Eisenbergiella merdipullorum]|uniref:Restriction endonuclease n=1 Tax=Candidatus Eisenbergiella merdipullorum TaxID=2838553 RepID=A0A9D2I4Q0_9FIRM|nr:restriction endonuclease [Candidatus Eisenbergiella merdipullorum]
MPTAFQYDLPRTKNAYEFEYMVVDYFKKQGAYAQCYGRKGQNQHGIDIIAKFTDSNEGSKYVAIQCKNYSPSEKELDQIIDRSITGIGTFPFSICRIVIALGVKRDTKIQNYIMGKEIPGITLYLLFWEDISSVIASNDDLMSRYYPQIPNNTSFINNLINYFNKGIQECHIINIMRNDPLAGMPSNYALDMDIFCIETEERLNDDILLQKNIIYQKIREFCNWIDYYNHYLSLRMQPAGSGYYSVVPGNSYEQMRNEIADIKTQINECYMAINSGCSIF